MTKRQQHMFTAFALGWSAGIGVASFASGHWVCGIVCMLLSLANVPYFIKGFNNEN